MRAGLLDESALGPSEEQEERRPLLSAAPEHDVVLSVFVEVATRRLSDVGVGCDSGNTLFDRDSIKGAGPVAVADEDRTANRKQLLEDLCILPDVAHGMGDGDIHRAVSVEVAEQRFEAPPTEPCSEVRSINKGEERRGAGYASRFPLRVERRLVRSLVRLARSDRCRTQYEEHATQDPAKTRPLHSQNLLHGTVQYQWIIMQDSLHE